MRISDWSSDVCSSDLLQDFAEGLTVTREMDPLTGVATRVVTEAKARGSAAKDLKPTIILVDAKGKQLTFPGTDIPAAYTLPPKSIISVEDRSEEHTSELQSLMRISYAVFCLKKKRQKNNHKKQIIDKQETYMNSKRQSYI